VRILVDPDLCQGHAMCEVEAPEVFSAPNGGPVDILISEPGPELHDAVTAAVKYCPTRALSIEET
jgi:ferredoxin